MRIEIINTGAELMLGRILNTHQQWLCRQLADLGLTVDRQVAIDDSGPAILQAVRDALAAQPDLVIATGGLGPTSDDRTRTLIAELLGKSLHEDPSVVAHIESFFTARHKRMPASCRVQAQVPDGATVLANAHGTAPGLVMELPPPPGRANPGLLILLPGPPRELRPMFTDQVVPILRRTFAGEAPFACRTLKTTGLGESVVEEKVAPPLDPLVQQGMDLGYCARVGEVELRFTARGPQAEALVRQAESIAREKLGDRIYGTDDDLLETVVIQEMTARQLTLAVAESCTGGLVAHRLTNVPGASAVLMAGFVTYSNDAKRQLLHVRPETLAAHGAVSEAVVREMAAGAREAAGTDFAVSVSGIAGPSGGTRDKPVGTVWMGLATRDKVVAQRCFNPYDRETFKFVSSQQVLDLLRRHVLAPAAAPLDS
jgi:nicotinamide-nucleotide amidase